MPLILSPLLLLAIAGLVVVILSGLILRAGRLRGEQAMARRVVLVLLGWLVLVLLGGRIDIFASATEFGPNAVPRFLVLGTLMSGPPLAVWLVWRASPAFRSLASGLGLPALVGLQTYRVGGLFFLLAVLEGTAHPWFGGATAAADILVGLAALPLALALARGRGWARRAAIGHAVFGLADFAHAIALVTLCLFGLLALIPDPALVGVSPGLIVTLFQLPLAVILHALVLHRLLSPAASPNPETAHVA